MRFIQLKITFHNSWLISLLAFPAETAMDNYGRDHRVILIEHVKRKSNVTVLQNRLQCGVIEIIVPNIIQVLCTKYTKKNRYNYYFEQVPNQITDYLLHWTSAYHL